MANQHKNSLAHVHLPVIELRLRAHNPVEDRGKYSQSGSVCYHLLSKATGQRSVTRFNPPKVFRINVSGKRTVTDEMMVS